MPSVSIIIATKNEENYIVKCLQSIINSDFPKEELEVFVCDGKSTDNTQEQVKKMEQTYAYIHLLINKKETAPHAFNLGIKASLSDYKIILGAHAEIEKDFINKNIEVVDRKKDPKLACVGGILENIYENKNSKIIGYAMSNPFGVGNAHFRTGKKAGYVDTVAFGCYKAKLFEKIGYFDESLARNQDDEFNFRLIKHGYKIYLSPQIRSKYYVRASFSKLFKQYYQYGYWKVVVNQKHKKITTLRQLAPLFFLLFLSFGFLLALFSAIFLYLYIFGLLLYTLLAVFSTLKYNLGFLEKLKLIKTFLILHISYGFGYLTALKDIIFLRKFASDKKLKITR